MFKYISTVVLVLLVGGSWYHHHQMNLKSQALAEKIEQHSYDSHMNDEVQKMKKELGSLKGQKVFNGILLTFLCSGLVGILVVSHILPWFANKVSLGMYGSDEKVEVDAFHKARVLMAQGEWEAAIEAFQEATKEDPSNRMAWAEIVKIQRQHLLNPPAALATLRQAIEGHDWEIDDVAFLMFRLAEIYDEDFQDRANAGSVLSQIMELFPQTRHSANARTKLHEWKMI